MIGLNSEKGQSLIQMMISIGIMGILITGFASMMTNQQKEMRALGEKISSLDLQRTLTQIFAANGPGSLCESIMTNPVQVFSAPATYPSLAAFNLNQIPISVGSSVNIIQVGQPVDSTSNLKVTAIQIDLIDAPVAGVFPANLTVVFDPLSTIRTIKNIKLPIYLQTSGTGTYTVTGCGVSTSSGGPRWISGGGCEDCPYGSLSFGGGGAKSGRCYGKDFDGGLFDPDSTGSCADGEGDSKGWGMWSY